MSQEYSEKDANAVQHDATWRLLKDGLEVDSKDGILAIRGSKAKLEEARKLLELQSKLHGLEVAKW